MIPYESETNNTSSKDRDYILDYKSVDITGLDNSVIFGVPINNVARDEAIALILDMIENQTGPKHIMFLDPLKLMRIHFGPKIRSSLNYTKLYFADGAGIPWASRRLGKPLKERIPMINILMDVIRLAEKKEMTLYFLGSRMERVEQAFFNIKKSFPAIRIIGRQGGYFDPARENLIKESLRKSSPDIVFVGMGFPYQEKWISDNIECFRNSMIFSVDGFFDILSGRERKAPDWMQLRGLLWFWRTIKNPLKINKLFNMVLFYVYIIISSLFVKK